MYNDEEVKELMTGLPLEAPFYPNRKEGEIGLWEQVHNTPSNAVVLRRKEGGLSIFLSDGGWLGCQPEDIKGDMGPFAG